MQLKRKHGEAEKSVADNMGKRQKIEKLLQEAGVGREESVSKVEY
jgi:hypothetical protein